MEGNNAAAAKKVYITKDRSFYKSLIRLAIPIVLQNMVTFLVGFADHLMIGRLGDIVVSGVYMGGQFQTVLQMFTSGVEGAILILAAQYWGIRDLQSIKKISAMGMRYSLAAAALLNLLVVLFPRFFLGLFTNDEAVIESAVSYVLITAFSYVFFAAAQMLIATLRAVENARLGFYVSLAALFINVSLNYLFIFGVTVGGREILPAMGIRGAAIATLISRIAEFLIVFIYTLRFEKVLKLRVRDFLLKDPLLRKDLIRYGTPVLAGQLVWAVNMLAYSSIMGHLSAGAVTASSIVGQFESLLRVGTFGLSAALGIITGKTVGAGLFEKMKEYTRTAEILFLVIGLLSGLIIHFMAAPFISLYDISEEAVQHSRDFFRVLTFTYIGTSWQATCLSGLVKPGGDTAFVFKNDSIFVFLVMIPGGILAMLLGAPAWLVFLVLKCDQILKCIVAFFKINSFNWMKKLTREDAA
ncbi:MAG: hypothetical protein IJM76_05165 [Lachnospiraceae bacterium]|nr:hypothetical protein [Lachnospiraceae bacterium]